MEWSVSIWELSCAVQTIQVTIITRVNSGKMQEGVNLFKKSSDTLQLNKNSQA